VAKRPNMNEKEIAELLANEQEEDDDDPFKDLETRPVTFVSAPPYIPRPAQEEDTLTGSQSGYYRLDLNGDSLEVGMSRVAKCDEPFLKMWLHGESEKTKRAYSNDMRKFYDFVECSLDQVRPEDIQAFIDSLAGLRRASRARILVGLKSALSFAVKTGYLPASIVNQVNLSI
jgi:hypothetical protein